MKKILIILLLIICVGCTKVENQELKKEEIINKEEVSSVKVIINEKEYILNLEDNETVDKFLELLPSDFNMTELNGNEKYINLDTTLPTDSMYPKHINAGDVMLYGNNCIVVFYKSFDSKYSYTKIGHIPNLPDLGSDDITIRFEK